MRVSSGFVLLFASSALAAGWFSSEPEPYKDWDVSKLTVWLKKHNIPVPTTSYTQGELAALVKSNWYDGTSWTQKQLDSAKGAYTNVQDTTLDTWNESQLREFLVKQGVVAPSGPREQLLQAARKQYWSYQSAVSSVSAAASTAVYGDKAYQATKSAVSVSSVATSYAASASKAVHSVLASSAANAQASLDASKDYVYSTWSDNDLRSYLEEKGVIKSKTQATRDELLAKMKDNYAAATDPVWKAWSDSYLYEWLHSRGLVRTDYEKKRDKLTKAAETYYYDTKDTAYSSWDESQLKEWLVAHDIIKSDAQLKKEKLQKLVADNYSSATDTIYGGWRDSDIRDWLIQNNYLRSDAQVKKDELVKLFSDKYNNLSASTASYLTWPDARLRAFLRANGVDDRYIPSTRPGLLQETRVRWVQTSNTATGLWQSVYDGVRSVIEGVEDQLSGLLATLTGTKQDLKKRAGDAYEEAGKSARTAQYEAASFAADKASSASAAAAQKSKDAKAEL